MKTYREWAACLAAVVIAGAASAENWPQWRGPASNGSTTEANLPATFSRTENVLWSAEPPGAGGAGPIVWQDRVFLSSQAGEKGQMYATCLSAADGKELWRHPMGGGFTNRMGNTGTSLPPVTDGKWVWYLFGSGKMEAFGMDGQPRWRRDIDARHGPFEIMREYGAGPLLFGGRLYLAVLRAGQAARAGEAVCLLCLDPATGKDLWSVPLQTDAQGESRRAYGTAFPLVEQAGTQVLLLGGDRLTAHDPADGHELWRSANTNPRNGAWWATVPSPVGADGWAIACAPAGGPLLAVRTRDEGADKAGSTRWTSARHCSDACTPLLYRGKLIVLDGRQKIIACLDPATGKGLWEGKLDAKAAFQASPTGADGRIYCISLAGEAFVLAVDEFKVVHRADMGGQGGCRATIAAAAGRLWVRVEDKLYCIGKGR